MTLLAKYSRVALLVVGVCLIGLAVAQEAAKDPAAEGKPMMDGKPAGGEKPVMDGAKPADWMTDQIPLSVQVAGLLDVPEADVKQMALNTAKEGMQYVCDYKAAPDAAADASAQGLFECGMQCTPAVVMALPACTTIGGCFTALMPALGSCSDCADTICQNSIVNMIAAPICQSAACQLLPDPVPAACAGVCSFCGF